jgi:AraC-like DNA-binding protein
MKQQRIVGSVSAIWPRLRLRSMCMPGKDGVVLEPTERNHAWLFGADVTVSVRNAGQAGWRTLRISKGDVVLRPTGLPAQEKRWQASAPVDLIHVAFEPAHLPATPRYLLAADTIFKLQDPLIGMLMRALYRAAARRWRGEHRYVDAASELLCLQIAESLADAMPAIGPGALPAAALRSICAHIDARLSRPLRLGELAALAELSPRQFLRAFKASTGESPVRFVQRRRVLLAQELLRSSERSLVEIAHDTGFGSQSRFTTAFRTLVGEAPARYRKARRGP